MKAPHRIVLPLVVVVLATLLTLVLGKGPPGPTSLQPPDPTVPTPELPAPASASTELEAPPVPVVPLSALKDGVLSLLVFGDEQAVDTELDAKDRWPSQAGQILGDRLRRAGATWSVDVLVSGGAGATARDAWDSIHDRLGAPPDLVLVAVGWNDGGPGSPQDAPPAARLGAPWLDEVAGAPVVPPAPDVEAIRRFYLRDEKSPRMLPHAHVATLDAIQQALAQVGRPVVFIEEAVAQRQGARMVLATTGGKLRPWISTAQGLEMAGGPDLFRGGRGVRLTATGHRAMGSFVGMGLMQFLPLP